MKTQFYFQIQFNSQGRKEEHIVKHSRLSELKHTDSLAVQIFYYGVAWHGITGHQHQNQHQGLGAEDEASPKSYRPPCLKMNVGLLR